MLGRRCSMDNVVLKIVILRDNNKVSDSIDKYKIIEESEF